MPPSWLQLEVEVAWELELLTGLVHSVIRSVSYIQSSAESAGIDALCATTAIIELMLSCSEVAGI